MPEHAQPVFVLTHQSGRSLALRPLAPQAFVLDDLDEGKALGEVVATLTPFVIDIDGAAFVVLAGPAEGQAHTWTVIEFPDTAAGSGHFYPVKNGVWMSFPEPFTPGMQITAIWQEGDFEHRRELFRLTSPPLHAHKLAPMFGPGWTGYGPRSD